MSQQRKPDQTQIEEWFESLTTEYFFSLISKAKQVYEVELRDQGFDTDSAERLMGQRGHLWGQRTAFEQVEDIFVSKSFSELEEEDEPIGDSPDRGPGTD